MAIKTHILVIILNANELNPPIKRHRLAEQIKKKNKTHVYAVYKRLTSDLETYTD